MSDESKERLSDHSHELEKEESDSIVSTEELFVKEPKDSTSSLVKKDIPLKDQQQGGHVCLVEDDQLKIHLEPTLSYEYKLLSCDRCLEARSSIIQCLHCGDKVEETEFISPYQRLQLDPQPLYSHYEVQRAKENLLVIFHPLKASRLNAKWSLKQRALICRDSQALSSISGALSIYLKYLKVTQFDLAKVESWDLKIPDEEKVQEFLEIKLLDSAFTELAEYDGYQERERLLNRISRDLLEKGLDIADRLNSDVISQDDFKKIDKEVQLLSCIESWLDRHRQTA